MRKVNNMNRVRLNRIVQDEFRNMITRLRGTKRQLNQNICVFIKLQLILVSNSIIHVHMFPFYDSKDLYFMKTKLN